MFSTKLNTTAANELTAAELLYVQTGASGVLELTEGAAPSTTSGKGKIYVKSSDSKLYFKDDGGTEYDLTAAAAAGANTALSNLAAVAINTALVSDTDNTDALGTTAIAWSDLFLGSGAVIQFNSAPSTSDVTITHSANTLTLAGGSLVLPDAGLTVGASIPFSDSAGTLTLQNIDAIDATTEATIEAAIDTLANLTSIQGRTVTLADAGANAIFGWDDTAGAYENLTQAEARTVLGLGTAAYVATDLADLNEATIEGAIDTLANLTSVQGRTVTLADAGANAIFGWDDVAGAYENLSQAEVLAVIGDSSTTAKGVVEIAIASEVNTGTDAGRAVSPDSLAGSYAGTKVVEAIVVDYTTDTATGDGKFYFTVPSTLNGMNLVAVHARVITAGTTGTTDIQIANVTQAADMLTTKITIDSGETGSDTAATPPVIDTGNDDVATNDLIRIDVDAVSTTKAKGLIVRMEFQLP